MSSEEFPTTLDIDHTRQNTAPSGDSLGTGYHNNKILTVEQLAKLRRQRDISDALGDVAAACEKQDNKNEPAKPERASMKELVDYLKNLGRGVQKLRKWMLEHRGSQEADAILDPEKNVGAVGSVNAERTLDGELNPNYWSQAMEEDTEESLASDAAVQEKPADWTLAA